MKHIGLAWKIRNLVLSLNEEQRTSVAIFNDNNHFHIYYQLQH